MVLKLAISLETDTEQVHVHQVGILSVPGVPCIVELGPQQREDWTGWSNVQEPSHSNNLIWGGILQWRFHFLELLKALALSGWGVVSAMSELKVVPQLKVFNKLQHDAPLLLLIKDLNNNCVLFHNLKTYPENETQNSRAVIHRLWKEVLAYYTPLSPDFLSLPQKPTQKSQNSTTHSLPFTSDIPKLSHLFKSIFVSLQAKWSVWIYSYFPLSFVYLLLSHIFPISLSQMYIFSLQCNPSIFLTLRFHLAIFFSVCFTVSLLLPLPISLVLCLGQSNPSDFKNHIIQSGPTQ